MAVPTPTVAPAIVKGRTRRGTGRWIWIPTVASFSTGATLAEFSAGTDYTNQINALDGFAPSPSTAAFGNAGSLIIPTIPSTTDLGSGTITFNLSDDPSVSDARADFNDGLDGTTPTSGFWADAPNGIVTSATYKLYAAAVQSAPLSTDLDNALTLPVVFALSAVSGFLTIPTA